MADSNTTVACGRCGALNDSDFGHCIRCNQGLSRTEPAAKAARRVPAPRGASARVGVQGPGSEPLFGVYAADVLPGAKILLFLNLVVFMGHLISAFALEPGLDTLISGGSPLEALRFGALPLFPVNVPPLDPWMFRSESWRTLTACYVHFGALHVGMNMMGLIYLARIVEPAIGSIRFIIAYTLCGIAGNVASVAWFLLLGKQNITAGASGAVFGLMGIFLGYLVRRKDPRWKPWAIRAVGGSLAIALIMPMSINHTAHIGGLIMGIACGYAFGHGAPKPSAPWQRGAAALCIIATLGALLAARFSPYFERLAASVV